MQSGRRVGGALAGCALLAESDDREVREARLEAEPFFDLIPGGVKVLYAGRLSKEKGVNCAARIVAGDPRPTHRVSTGGCLGDRGFAEGRANLEIWTDETQTQTSASEGGDREWSERPKRMQGSQCS